MKCPRIKLSEKFKRVILITLKSSFICLCSVLCSYQLYEQVYNYSQYNVYVSTSFGPISLPTISICMYYAKIYGGDGGKPREVGQLLVSPYYSFDRRILQCHLTLNNGMIMNCRLITSSTRMMSVDYMCHSLFHHDQSNSRARVVDRYSRTNFLSLDINLTDTENLNSIALYTLRNRAIKATK